MVKVWFDSECPLCAREIKIMRKLDWFNKVDFVDVLSTPDCPIQRKHLLEKFHAQLLGGPLLSGAAAFALLWIITTSSSSWGNSEDPIRSSDPRVPLS